MHDFTPPFLGTSKIAQFTVTSSFWLGAWLIGAAMALQAGAAFVSRKPAQLVRSASATKPAARKRIAARQIACQI